VIMKMMNLNSSFHSDHQKLKIITKPPVETSQIRLVKEHGLLTAQAG